MHLYCFWHPSAVVIRDVKGVSSVVDISLHADADFPTFHGSLFLQLLECLLLLASLFSLFSHCY